MKGVVVLRSANEKFVNWAESLTVEKIGLCVLIMLIAAFSLGFCIGKHTESSIREQIPDIPSDEYKLDLIYQMEVSGK